MNLSLAHLNLTLIQAHGLITGHGRHEGGDGDVIDPTTTAPHPRSGGGSGGGLFDYFVRSGVRGAGWSMGSRPVHMLPTPVDPFRIGLAAAAVPRFPGGAPPHCLNHLVGAFDRVKPLELPAPPESRTSRALS
jgi:hypothetical protein